METSDQIMAGSRAVLDRRTADAAGLPIEGFDPARRARRTRAIARRLTRIAVADAAILVAALAIGLAMPLGLFGALGVFILLLAATALLAVWPGEPAAPPPPQPESLKAADLKALPAQTGRWLAAQRAALPAPARTLVDQIGLRLDTLGPQLAALEPGAPAGEDVRKLVAEQLPEFVRGYQRVPATLRATPRNGRTPDAQLTDGLALIDRQLAQMSAGLAEGDLDALATRGRYLEIKYQGSD